MNRTKSFRNILIGLLAVLTFCLTPSCSGDDKDESIKDQLTQNSIIGTWDIVGSESGDWYSPCRFRFGENDKLTIIYNSGTSYQESVPYKYTIQGSKITIESYDGEVIEGTYKIDGKIFGRDKLTLDVIIYDLEYPDEVYSDFLTLARY